MADTDRASGKLHDALATIIRDEQSAMVSKWVALVEVIGEDGNAALWSLTSDSLSMWDRLGMVEFHSRLIQPERGHDDEDAR